MARVTGLPLGRIDKLGNQYAAKVTAALRRTLKQLANNLDPLNPSVDNITDLWRTEVDNGLIAELGNAYINSARFVYDQLVKKRDALTAAVSLEPVMNHAAEVYLDSRMNFIRNIGFDTWTVVQSQLLEGLREGESIEQISTRIRGSTSIAEPRATVIARTEIIGASNAGSYQQMITSKLPATKTWLATGGGRTRPSHAAADGQEVPMDESFDVGGWSMLRPHDESAPASEVVNCRCTLTFEIGDEEFQEDEELVGETNPELDDLLGQEFNTLEAGKEFISDFFGDWEQALTNPEYSARSFYQSPGFALMNGQLRGLAKADIKSDVSFTDADLLRAKKASTNLKKAINKAPPLQESLIVHRGFSADQFGDLVKGMRIKDKAFTSTSLMDDVTAVGKANSPAVARIEIPAGTKVGAGSSRELILQAGSQFDVLSVTVKNGVTHVDLRLVT